MVKRLTISLFVILLIVWCSLVKAETTSYVGSVSFYTGNTGWIDKFSADEQANIGSILLTQVGIENEIYTSDTDGADLADWMQQATGNGQLDVLVLYGSCPSEIYSNQQPDDSIAERFIESTDGDAIINHADYMFYVGWESSTDPSSGESSGNNIWNQDRGLQNIMDIPSITMWPSNWDNPDQCVVTPLGQEISPTLGLLENLVTYRPFHVNEIEDSSWQVEAVLAQNSDGSLADPIILRDGNRGRLIPCFQIENPTEPIGVIGAEIITWLYRNNHAAQIDAPTHSYTRSFELALETGINMISMPLNVKRIQKDGSWVAISEGESLTASQLVSSMNSFWVIRFDQSDGLFKAYVPPSESMGEDARQSYKKLMDFSLESGKGYLVNVTEAKTVNLEGMPWGTPIFDGELLLSDKGVGEKSPQILAAPSVQETGPWAFVVSGHIAGVVTKRTEIVVTNLRTGTSTPSTVSVGKSTTTNIGQPSYTAVFVDPNRKPLVSSGDVYQVTIIDPSIDPIQHQFRVESTHLSAAHLTANTRLSSQVPEITRLGQNYPNPFNPETWVPYQLHQPAAVSVTIYNVAGAMVRQISVGFRPAGSYQSMGRAVYWDGRTDYGETVASGVYFYTLQAGDFTATRRLVILK